MFVKITAILGDRNTSLQGNADLRPLNYIMGTRILIAFIWMGKSIRVQIKGLTIART